MLKTSKNYLFTSESVSCGHPDKVCDQISDAILDEFLKQDRDAKVAVECFITNNMLVVGGEAHSTADVDIIGTAKRVIEEIGYDGTNGFDPESAVFVNTLHEQSADIRQGVERGVEEDTGAGDQGLMFGYACNETKEYLPVGIVLANDTMRIYDRLRKEGKLPGTRPDAKCQFTIEYDGETNEPVGIDTILISMQHEPDMLVTTLKQYFLEYILPELKANHAEISYIFEGNFRLLVNPTGRFVIGGPEGDTGLTGRKIIVDTYGGKCPHGGGAFSGKDCTKVDRSAAYAARYAAKCIVAAGMAKEATVQLSYAIGVPEPISIHVEAKGYDGEIRYENYVLEDLIRECFPVTPYEIINHFELRNPVYGETATYGHFGNEKFTWEKLNPDVLRAAKAFADCYDNFRESIKRP